MNIWMLLGAIVILWAFAFSLMYFSLWLEERRERKRERQVAKRLRVTVGALEATKRHGLSELESI